MKEEILKRAMFAMPLSKEARSSGIMSGFDLDEMEADENRDMEEMPAMARTPQNPEILMNNLRGDMRSVDARYQELAQMVGEEAAMETPPEVLAMLQPQLAAQQGGIGALPQGQGMMPPGAQAAAPAQMGGAPMQAPQQPGPAMPQGGIPMPQGMESAPPFSQGAEAPKGYAYGGPVESTMPGNYYEEAPPTPDGMPPMYAAAGAFINPAMRAAQFLGDKASAVNAALGRMYMSPSMTQPFLENVRGPGGKYTAEQIARGGDLLYPTFTQGLGQAIATTADKYPRIAAMAAPALGALGLAAAPRSGVPSGSSALAEQIPTDTREELVAAGQRPVTMSLDMNTGMMQRPGEAAVPIPVRTEVPAPAPMLEAPAGEAAAPPGDELGDFITEKLAAFDKRQEGKGVAAGIKEAVKAKTKMERIKEAQAEYAPLYEEILGSDKEAAKTNALLLLAEAGLKLASTRKPTFAMALGESFAGVPRGLAAIAAQERELGVKGKLGALEKAISDVESEDKYAQALNLQFLKGEQEIQKKLADKKTNIVYENVGVGGRVAKDANGSYIGFGIEQRDPIVQDIRNNPEIVTNFTSNNPFARDLGKATTATRENPKSREAALERFNLLSAQVANVDRALGMVENAFSPGTFVVNAVNNLVVPVTPNFLVRPDVDKAAVISGLKNVFSDLTRGDAEIGGKISVQGEKWQRENLNTVANPDNFFKNPELAAKVYQQRKTDYLNEMYRVGTELGLFDRNIVVSTPPTGTRNDPFVIPKDPAEQQRMASYLQSAFSTARNPQSMIYMRDHKGDVVQVPINKFLNPKAGN